MKQLLLFLAFIAGFALLGIILRSSINKRLKKCIELKDYETYLNILDSWFVKLLFQPYHVEYMRLNAYLSLRQKEKIDEKFSLLLSARKTPQQTENIYLKAFLYYVKENDKKRCSELLKEIESLGHREMVKQTRIMYDTYILKESHYIQDLLNELETTEEKNRGPIEYLLALQYKNAGNKKKADEYERLSKKHMLDNIS